MEHVVNRSRLYKTAVILQIILSIYAIGTAFSGLLNGPNNQGILQGVPQILIVFSALLGVVGLVSAFGIWNGQKWAIWLAIILQAFNGFWALPGVIFSPLPWGKLSSTLIVLTAIFIVFVLLRRNEQPL